MDLLLTQICFQDFVLCDSQTCDIVWQWQCNRIKWIHSLSSDDGLMRKSGTCARRLCGSAAAHQQQSKRPHCRQTAPMLMSSFSNCLETVWSADRNTWSGPAIMACHVLANNSCATSEHSEWKLFWCHLFFIVDYQNLRMVTSVFWIHCSVSVSVTELPTGFLAFAPDVIPISEQRLRRWCAVAMRTSKMIWVLLIHISTALALMDGGDYIR